MKNKQWYRVIVVELSFLAWPLVSFAQQPQSLTLSEAIQLALKSNRQLQAAQQYTDAAKSAAGQAKGAFFPRLDMIEAFNYTDKPTLVFSNLLDQSSFKQKNFAIGSLNNPTPLTNLASQIRLEQPIYAGGKLSANLGQATAFAESSQEATRRTRQEIIAAVVEAYYRVILAEANADVIKQSLASARAHLGVTQDLFRKRFGRTIGCAAHSGAGGKS